MQHRFLTHSRKRFALKIIIAVLCLLLLCGVSTLAQTDPPAFEPVPCMFNQPGGFVIDCGYVTVPESRDSTQGDNNNLRLAVAILKSLNPRPDADPIIYLDGGPGGHTLNSLEFFAASFRPFLDSRDVIFFDQRGVGYSGSLDCPAYNAFSYELLDQDIPFAEVIDLSVEQLLACREEHVSAGANLAAYTSAESANDVRDLVTALGYEQVNLFGISYGTRLALTVMRDHPDIVRSAILDGVFPPQVNPDSALLPNAHHAFSTLFEGCERDRACAMQYPDLETVFYETVNRLNAEPVTMSTFDFYTREDRDVLINGDVLIGALFSLLYQTNQIASLPRVIYEVRDGNYDVIIHETLFRLYTGEFFDEALYQSIACNEETPFDTPDAVTAAGDGLPDPLRDIFLTQVVANFDLCAAWVEPPLNSADNEAVTSDIPTLITVGEYDPITPPQWAQAAAETLSNSILYEFPGVGHSAFTGSPCATSLMIQFVHDPQQEPDASCVDNIAPPLFATAEIESVTLKPHSDEILGFTSMIPENWYEVEPGVFSPFPAMDQPTPVIAFRFPVSLDEYVNRIILSGFYGYDNLPNYRERFEINGRVWTTYYIERPDQAIYTSFAFSETDFPYVIGVTATSPEERDRLYDAVLMPAVEAFASTGEISE